MRVPVFLKQSVHIHSYPRIYTNRIVLSDIMRSHIQNKHSSELKYSDNTSRLFCFGRIILSEFARYAYFDTNQLKRPFDKNTPI